MRLKNGMESESLFSDLTQGIKRPVLIGNNYRRLAEVSEDSFKLV